MPTSEQAKTYAASPITYVGPDLPTSDLVEGKLFYKSGSSSGMYIYLDSGWTTASTLQDLSTYATMSWVNTNAVKSFNTRMGVVTLTSGDVTGALGYTPYSTSGGTISGNVSLAANFNINLNGTGSIYTANWFRSSGATGWYNGDFAGGIYMTDTTWVRVYGNKHFRVENSNVTSQPAIYASTSGGVANYAIVGVPGHSGYGGVLGYAQNNAYYGVLGYANQYALYGAGDIYVTGNITAFSDERAKKEIRTFDNALQTVERLRGVKFQWKDSGKEDVGVIAQEVAGVIPQIISETPDGKLAVNYQVIVAPLIEAIKELSASVKSYRRENLTMRTEIEELKAQVNQLISSQE